MTMEEATELFGMMQGMLRASELGRQAALRAMSAAPVPSGTTPSKPAAVAAAPGGAPSSDDLLLLGLLGTGAAAGVLAALTKRIQELTGAPDTAGRLKSSGPPS